MCIDICIFTHSIYTVRDYVNHKGWDANELALGWGEQAPALPVHVVFDETGEGLPPFEVL